VQVLFTNVHPAENPPAPPPPEYDVDEPPPPPPAMHTAYTRLMPAGIVTEPDEVIVCCNFNPNGTSENDELVFIFALIVLSF
jgi:hypothetical protein